MVDEIQTLLPEGLLQVRAQGLCCHVLLRHEEVVLIDTGGPQHLPLIRNALALNGRRLSDVSAIVLTHASVRHGFTASEIRARSGAKVYIHRFDEPRLWFQHPSSERHTRRARIEWWRAYRRGYAPPEVDFFIGDGDVLDLWFGLRVMHLPGPTPGHCGLYCRHLDVLFTGALPMTDHRPRLLDRLCTVDPEAQVASVAQARAVGAKLVCGDR